MTSVVVIGTAANLTNLGIVAAWRSCGLDTSLLSAAEARDLVGPGDVALGRLDVARTLDGVEPGLLDLLLLERSGMDVRNPAVALLRAHDKLRTAALLTAAGIPHPRTAVVRSAENGSPLAPPLVIKPRFGSWGQDVHRCSTEHAVRQCLRAAAEQSWFRRHGALVQELVDTSERSDLRVLVAGRTLVGACTRTAATGEWRTNTALGGTRAPAVPDHAARRLALRAVSAIGCDLVGVDLAPLSTGGYTVLELNGAIDFDDIYSLPGRDVFRDAAAALRLDGRSDRRAASGGA
jgi:RimK family alpha-L-glutamate ligase